MPDSETTGRSLRLGEMLVSPTIQRVALPLVSFMMMLFFFFQGPLIFGSSWKQWETITLAYIVMVIISVMLNPKSLALEAWRVLLLFGISLAVGLTLFYAVFSGFRYGTSFPTGNILPTILYQVFVISYAEEAFFRGALTERFRVLPSAGAFALFHLAAYSIGGLNITLLFVAFGMGFALGYVYLYTRDFAGIGIVWGLHLGWNLALILLVLT